MFPFKYSWFPLVSLSIVIACPLQAEHPDHHPDDHTIVTNVPWPTVYIMDFDGVAAVPGTARALSPRGFFHQAMVSPDGNCVVFWGHEPGETGFNIWKRDLSTDILTKLTHDHAVSGHPYWTPDGKQILFFSTLSASDLTDWSYVDQFDEHRKARNLWIMDRDGSNRKRLTTGNFIDERPCISPDGRTVVFVSTRSGHMNLWSLDLTTQLMKPITTHDGLDYRPTFSPDGKTLAFFTTNHPRRCRDLAIMDWATGQITFPVAPGIFDWIHGPFWLKDNTTILFHASPMGQASNSLYLLDLTASTPQRVNVNGVRRYGHGTLNAAEDRLVFDSADRVECRDDNNTGLAP